MKWIDPEDELPPQGKKILYFSNGDIYVVQRFDNMWVPIPFHDSKYAFHEAPELWCDIQPPKGFTGKLRFMNEETDRLLDLDDFQMFYPDEYDELIEHTKKLWIYKEENE